MKHGFLLIDKPEGPTSHDVVGMVRKTLGERKIGHLGTLDPAASGLMVLAVGAKALKVVELFTSLSKAYEADITFGAISSTYDREGIVATYERKPGVEPPEDIALRRVIEDRFVGKIDQVPPEHSAVHVGGERAYRKARQGVKVNMPSREVDIRACTILSYAYPRLILGVECGSGTYIRSLAHDLGQAIRCGGYLSGLRRTKVGDWSIDDAVSIENVAWGHVLPLKDVLIGFQRLDITADEANDIAHGRFIDHQVKRDTIAWSEGLPIAILEPLKDCSQQCKGRKVL